MIIDCHIHTWGGETGDDLLRGLDRAGLDAAFFLSPYFGHHPEEQKLGLIDFARVVSADPSRILGFAWIEPTAPGAVDEARRAAEQHRFAGIKLMPNHWYPYEERLFPFYRAAEEAGLPILFHAGILWNFLDSSRFCRPVYYEVMLHFPRLRFALAHLAWPWVDECLAVAARMKAGAERETGGENQMFLDLSPGTPPSERPGAFRKTLDQVGTSRLLWGSDDHEPLKMEKSARVRARDEEILRDELGLGAEAMADVMGRNHLRFLKGSAA